MSNTVIKIYRDKYIEESVDVAIIKLDTMIHQKGVLCMINYYTSDNHNTFDTVFASGVKDGVGRDCYRIISLRQENMIWGVGDTLPDVSNLIHGEKYLYRDTQNNWWLVQIASDGRTRELLRLPTTPTNYTLIYDNSKWLSDSHGVRRLGDTYTREEIDDFIQESINTVKYVEFDSLTPTQIEQIRGPKGDQGDKGEKGDQGLQGERGIRGFNGTIENFVVLSQADYDALDYVDPYKFYFTYEDEEQNPTGDFYAYVLEHILYIYASESDHILEINSEYASEDNHTLELAASSTACSSPIFSPGEGTYNGSQTITISCPTEGANIYYTLDRSIPDQNSLLYENALTLDNSAVIKARAYKPGLLGSLIVEATYDLLFQTTVSDPVLDKEDGVYENPFYVSISCPTNGAIIRFTLDGTEPNESSTIYLSPILIEGYTTTVRAKAFKGGMNSSNTVSGIYRIGNVISVSTPVFEPAGGTYTTNQEVSISCSTNNVTIRYTLDGSDPTPSSNLYAGPISITQTTTIKAKAYRSDMEPSNIASQTYIINSSEPDPDPPTPGTDDPVVENHILKNINGIVEGTILNISYTVNNNNLIII